ncbi:hypothetical protein AeRB84_004691 [Aphanomyces euteiches]|nr:hypothetical protein AeRB84_004691 [Aphanomyces euteiches]
MPSLKSVVLASLGALVGANTSLLTCSSNASRFSLQDQSGHVKVVEFPNAANGTLDLSSVDIQTIQSTGCTSLSSLNLSSNLLSVAQDILLLPPSLELLDLSYNRLNILENVDFASFPNLQTLILKGNNLSALQNVSFPSSLATLDLSDNPLDTVVLSLESFAQMVKMNLSMQSIHQKGQGNVDTKRICHVGQLYYIPANGTGIDQVGGHGTSNAVCVVNTETALNRGKSAKGNYMNRHCKLILL